MGMNLARLAETLIGIKAASDAGRLAGEQQRQQQQLAALPHLLNMHQAGAAAEEERRRGELEALRQGALIPGQTPESQHANWRAYLDGFGRLSQQPRQYGPESLRGIYGTMPGPLGQAARQMPGSMQGADPRFPGGQSNGVAPSIRQAQTPQVPQAPQAPQLQFRDPGDDGLYENTIAALMQRLKPGPEAETDAEARTRYVQAVRALHRAKAQGRPYAEVVQELGGDPLANIKPPSVDRKRATSVYARVEPWKKRLSTALASPDLAPEDRQAIESLLSTLPATAETPEDLATLERFLQQAPSYAAFGETKARDARQAALLARAKLLDSAVENALKTGNPKATLEAIQRQRAFAAQNPELPGVQPYGGDDFSDTPQAIRRKVRVPTAGMEALPGQAGAIGALVAGAMPFVETEADGTETPEEIRVRMLDRAAEFAAKPADRMKFLRDGFNLIRQTMTGPRWDQLSEPEQAALLSKLGQYSDALGVPNPLPANFKAGKLTPYQQEQIKQRESDRDLRRQSAEEAARRFNATQLRLRDAQAGKGVTLDAGSREWLGQLRTQTANRWREYQAFVKSPDNTVFLGGFDPATDAATNPTQEKAKSLFNAYREMEADAAQFIKALPSAQAAPKTGGEARKTITIGGMSATLTYRELVAALSRNPLYKSNAAAKARALWGAK